MRPLYGLPSDTLATTCTTNVPPGAPPLNRGRRNGPLSGSLAESEPIHGVVAVKQGHNQRKQQHEEQCVRHIERAGEHRHEVDRTHDKPEVHDGHDRKFSRRRLDSSSTACQPMAQERVDDDDQPNAQEQLQVRCAAAGQDLAEDQT